MGGSYNDLSVVTNGVNNYILEISYDAVAHKSFLNRKFDEFYNIRNVFNTPYYSLVLGTNIHSIIFTGVKFIEKL